MWCVMLAPGHSVLRVVLNISSTPLKHSRIYLHYLVLRLYSKYTPLIEETLPHLLSYMRA